MQHMYKKYTTPWDRPKEIKMQPLWTEQCHSLLKQSAVRDHWRGNRRGEQVPQLQRGMQLFSPSCGGVSDAVSKVCKSSSFFTMTWLHRHQKQNIPHPLHHFSDACIMYVKWTFKPKLLYQSCHLLSLTQNTQTSWMDWVGKVLTTHACTPKLVFFHLWTLYIYIYIYDQEITVRYTCFSPALHDTTTVVSGAWEEWTGSTRQVKTRSLHSGHQINKIKKTYQAKFARQKLITGVGATKGMFRGKMMSQAQKTVATLSLHLFFPPILS